MEELSFNLSFYNQYLQGFLIILEGTFFIHMGDNTFVLSVTQLFSILYLFHFFMEFIL